MNVSDSSLMAGYLSGMGMKPAENLSKADVVVVNTCSVRDHAEHRALSYLGRLKPYKQQNPKLKIVFAGCAAERMGEKLVKRRFPQVDMVIGAKNLENFPKIFSKFVDSSQITDDGKTKKTKTLSTVNRQPSTAVSAFVTIMRGCENFCSYCVVPYVRGKELSRPAGEIIAEIKCLADRGVKDVTLLGQNVNSYKDCVKLNVKSVKKTTMDFPQLLNLINGIKGIERIRFMTSHPKDSGKKLIDAMASLDKVCPMLHLPLQSGSDRILKIMNRGYTSKDYLAIIDYLRKKIPGAAVTTDILTGFPGESDADFMKTAALVKKINYDFMYVFKYSPRPGTEAAKLKDSVPLKTKEKRHAALLEITNTTAGKKNAKLIGALQVVLVEGSQDGQCSGLTATNKKVYFPSKTGSKLIGKFVTVKITGSKINSLSGVLTTPLS